MRISLPVRLILVGSLLVGCSDIRGGTAAEGVTGDSLPLRNGLRLVVEPAIAGLPAGWRGQISVPGAKTISVEERSDDGLVLAWAGIRRDRVEVPAYGAPQYQDVPIDGRLRVADPSGSDPPASILVPGLWPAGRAITVDDGSGIWLSRKALTELRATGKTRWNAGLFEGALANLDLYILNNPDNPLVLKAAFNPLSDGPLDLFSPLGFMKAMLGYQVSEVDLP